MKQYMYMVVISSQNQNVCICVSVGANHITSSHNALYTHIRTQGYSLIQI